MPKAFFINSSKQTIEPVNLTSSDDLPKLINGYFEAVTCNDTDCILYVDEEGLLKHLTTFFAFGSFRSLIAGNGVLGGPWSPDGDDTDVTLTFEEVTKMVRFMSPEDVCKWLEEHGDETSSSVSFYYLSTNKMQELSHRTYNDTLGYMKEVVTKEK